MMLVTQYLDMLKDVGTSENNAKTLMPHSHNPSATIMVRDGIMAASTAQSNRNPKIGQLLGIRGREAGGFSQAQKDQATALRKKQAAQHEALKVEQEENQQRQKQQQQMQQQMQQSQQQVRAQQQQQVAMQQQQQMARRLMQAQQQQQQAMMRQQQMVQQQQQFGGGATRQFAVQVPQGCSPGQNLQIQVK